MRYWGFVRGLVLSIATAMLFAACGGGGGGGGGVPPVNELGRFLAALSGADETTITDGDARALITLRLRDDGTLDFAVVAELDWVGDIVGMHVHRGAAGVDGPIEVDLLGGGAAFDLATGTAAGTRTIPVALAAEIAAAPGGFYVNIHTGAAPTGFVRAQLASATTLELHATLLGDQELPPANPNARGAATFLVAANGRIDYVVAMREPAITDVTAAHIHAGDAGANGPIVVDLNLASGVRNAATGTIVGSVQVSLTELVRILLAEDDFYANVHSGAAPGGVARGQLESGSIGFWAALDGSKVSPVVNAAARGGVTLEFDSFSEGQAIFGVPPAQGVLNLTAANVYEGAAGSDGAAVIDLMAGPDFSERITPGTGEGTIAVDQALITRMMAHPEAFYANFKTAAATDGLVRGQLSQEPQTFFADLRGTSESVVINANARGTAAVVMTGVHECSFSILMGEPDATEIEDAHIHQGAVGQNDSILSSLLDGVHQIATSGITGTAVVSGQTFARLLAAPELFYINVHSAAAPAGLARGQCQHIAVDIPPAGLAYDSPVVYSTEVAIANNIPSSLGGAITSYTISPNLPLGLGLNSSTGVISGTPRAALPQTTFTVTGSNTEGTTTATIVMTVNLSAPGSLSYPTPLTFTQNTTISPVTPTAKGGKIANYGSSPTLPAGLTLNASTGVITGAPSGASAATNYTITGSNTSGSVTATINITVTSGLLAPSNLSYGAAVVYPTGTTITNKVPTVSGGAVATWSISPTTLPSGLNFNTSNGVISGTPDTVTALANFTVTATNATGSTTATVTITVTLGAPNTLTYSPSFGLGYFSPPLSISMTPSSQGGAVATYSSSPTLPGWVTFNTSTGAISGTPNQTLATTTYTITASNSAGSTTTTIQLSVPY